MDRYIYKALTPDGKPIKGKLIASNESELIRMITKNGNCVVSYIKESSESDSIKPIALRELSAFCSQLGSILRAGLPLSNSIEMLHERTIDPKFKKILGNVYETVQKGNPFSEGLQKQGKAFPILMINMVKSGEMSGALDDTMMKMADHYEKEVKMKNLVKSALSYPKILGIMCIGIVILLVTLILPGMVEGMAAEKIPAPTQFLLSLSDFLITKWYIIIFVVAIFYIAVPIIMKNPNVRYKLDKGKMNFPKVGPLIKKIYTSRFSRSLATLYECGIDLIDAMTMCSAIVGNVYVAEQVDEAVMKIKKGETISSAMSKIDSFDPLLTNMIFVGEESGVLGEILGRTADYFDEESEHATKGLTGLIQPFMMVIMGGIIGFIIVSMMMPMFAGYDDIGA